MMSAVPPRPETSPYLRPSERVMEFLLAELGRPGLRAKGRLPTVRQVARELKVSPRTVHGVFRQLAQQGRIRTAVGSGTFLASAPPGRGDRFTVGVVIPGRGNFRLDAWGQRMYGGMLGAVAGSSRSISLLPIHHGEREDEDFIRAVVEERSHIAGLILFPCPYGDRIRSAYEREGHLVVDLNPSTETATANFVSSDYVNTARRVAEAWRQTGRRRVLFLTSALSRSVSSRLRCSGLVMGLGADLGREVAFRIVESVSNSVGESDGAEAIRQELAGSAPPPDAIFCQGDFLALGALRALRDHGLRIPHDVSVVGGTGLSLSETPFPHLTRTLQPLEKAGEALIQLLLQRIEKKGTSLPGRVLETPLGGGATTRDEENRILGIRKEG